MKRVGFNVGAMSIDAAAQELRVVGSHDRHWRWNPPVRIAIFVACYALGSLVAYSLIDLSAAGAVFFPAAGVSVAALVLSPRSQWPAILAAIVVTEFVIDSLQGQPLWASLGFAAANSIEPLVGATLLSRATGVDLDLRRRRDLINFVVYAVLAGPLVGGVIGGSTIFLNWDSGWWESVLPFWAGDAMGVLTVGAAILTWRQLRQSVRDVVVAFALTAAFTAIVYWPTVPVAYLSMLPLVWLAFHVSIAALCAAGLGMTLAANVMTALGRGPWALLENVPNIEVATLQLFLAIAIISAWVLAVEIGARELASRQYQVERASGLQLQRELLPQIAATVSGVEVGALYRPSDVHNEVGGDWYDVFSPRAGVVSLVVGDIVGHDLPAAAAMGRAYTAVRLLAEQDYGSPGQLLKRLDDACRVLPEAAYSTVGYAEFFPESLRLAYACAGHPPPLLVDEEGARFLRDGRSPPVGIPQQSRSTGEVVLTGPARLVWFSDGLVERPGVPMERALERLRQLVESLPAADTPDEWCEAILSTMVAGQPVSDDIVVLCAALKPDSSEISDYSNVGRGRSGRL